MVLGLVELHVVVEDARRLVDVGAVVVGVHVLDGQEVGVPRAGVVDAEGDADEEDGDAADDVGDGVEGRDERGAEVAGDDAPVLEKWSMQFGRLRSKILTRDRAPSP